MKVSQNIKNLRRNSGLSQSELAERIYVSQQAVNKWEKGTSFPQIDRIEEISFALGCFPLEILYDHLSMRYSVLIDYTEPFREEMTLQRSKRTELSSLIADEMEQMLESKHGVMTANVCLTEYEYQLCSMLRREDMVHDDNTFLLDFWKQIAPGDYESHIRIQPYYRAILGSQNLQPVVV